MQEAHLKNKEESERIKRDAIVRQQQEEQKKKEEQRKMQAKIVAERIENKVAKQRPEGTDIN